MRTQTVKRLKPFDYAALGSFEREERVRGHARAINMLAKRTVANMVEIGRRLQQVKELVGEYWNEWLDAEFEWSESSAEGFMRVAAKFGHLDCLESFQPSALLYLATSHTQPAAIAEAVQRARAGEKITTTEAYRIKHRHDPAKPAAPLSAVAYLRKYVYRLAERLGRQFIAQQLRAIAAELQAGLRKSRAESGESRARGNCRRRLASHGTP